SLCSKDCKKNTDSLNSKIKELKSELSYSNNYWYSYKLGVAQLKDRLNEYKDREEKYIVKIRTLEMYRESNLESIKILTNEVETLKEEKDVVDGKLAHLLKSSKDLENIIESQRPSPTIVSTSAEDQNKDTSTSEDVASPNPPKPFVKRRVQRETNRSQNHSYKSSTHGSTGHRPNGAHMRPLLRSSGPRPHEDSMRPSFRPAGYRPHGPSMNLRRPIMNGARPYKSFFQTPSYETRYFLKSSAVKNPYRAPWVPTVNRYDPPVNRKVSTGRRNFPTTNRKFSTASRKFTTSSTKYHTADMGRKRKVGSSQSNIDDKDSECLVLGRNFKQLDDTNILLRTPRQHNMYSIDLNNIVRHKDLTCLVAKASADECILWHRRLGHLNVKTMNRLVRHNLVRGLPTKSFDNDHTCTACLKGKQHKASCNSKSKDETSDILKKFITEIENLKDYKVKIIRSKDETSDILKKFITKIENLKDLK
nr:ribonuclease H-like domain-containing protein [Tanacetum cinerariifolium]